MNDVALVLAAAVQAISAIVIATLTFYLVRSARRANEEQATSRALQSVPIVLMHKPETTIGEEVNSRWASTALTLTNGPAVALDVRVQLIGDVVRGRLPRHEAAITHIAVLAPGEQLTIRPSVNGLENPGFWQKVSPTSSDYYRAFMYDAIEIDVQCSGLLGAAVHEVYEWAPNPEKLSGIAEWRIRSIQISGPGLEAIEHQYPDDDEQWTSELADALTALRT